MNNGIVRPKLAGRHLDQDQLDRFCCAHGCQSETVDDAPVPLCGDHMRIAFAHVLMAAEGKSAEVVETVEEVKTVGYRARRRKNWRFVSRKQQFSGNGFVYFVRFANRIKIGWSSNPTRRLSQLPHDEVLAIIPGTMAEERQCHAAFAHLRITGEWFRAERGLRDFIKGLHKAA